MKIISYLVYIIFFETLVLGGCGVAVFGYGASGWWFLLAVLLSGAAYSPERWSSLWDTEIAERFRLQKKEEKAKANEQP